MENQIVLATRCCNSWTLLWIVIPPTVASISIGLIVSGPSTVQRMCLIAFLWIIMFPVLALAGLMTQSIFRRPFTAFINRVIKTRNGSA